MKIIFLILFILILFIILNKNTNIDILELMNLSESLYKDVQLEKLFKKIPNDNSGLKFGYICPGAIKTINYLKKQNISKEIKDKIISLTDFLFFIEIYAIYSEYLNENTLKQMKRVIGNNSCNISNLITKEITKLFGELPKNIRINLPDDFYHIRHDTLICSNSKLMVEKRIQLLKSIYENFDSHKCIGKRDGVSGCRDCCSQKYPDNYRNCVDLCMS